jgi:hypothetical protein
MVGGGGELSPAPVVDDRTFNNRLSSYEERV